MAYRPPIHASSLLSGFRCARSAPSSSRQIQRASVVSAPTLHFAARSFAASALQSGIFSRSSASSTSPAPTAPTAQAATAQATPVATPDDLPPTAFQSRIAELETAATASPESLSAQVELLKALAEGGEHKGLAGWYDHVALGEHGEEGGVSSKALLGSEEAWGLYMAALAQSGRLGEVVGKVRRRDELLKASGVLPTAGPAAAAPSALGSIGSGNASSATLGNTASTSTPATSTPTSASASTPTATAASSSFLSRLLGSKPASPAATSSAASPASSALAAQGVGAATGQIGTGTPLSPLYVQIAPPTPQANAGKAFRWLLGMAFWAFLILTVLSLVAENTGLLKAGSQPMEFEPEEGKVVKFSDVHGCEEAKTELEEIVEFLRNPEKFSALGGKLPKGVLLTGPPGTGKTLLARAVAGEAGVPFLFASGSSFDEMFVGVGAKRVRELFGAARKKAPAIIFIDELDAIGSKRSAKDAHYMKQTLNQLLVELDGFEQVEGVIIIAATNFPESLDKALTRPGRFDRHVTVGLPDVRGRISILKHHMADVAYDTDVDASVIARGCPGMSGADLQNLVNQAAVKASRDGSSTVQLKHFEWAKDRILMGAERKSHYVTEESKKSTAYHEGGHALVAMHTPGAMPLHKVTIMPRGPALGITFQLPEQDKDSYSRKEYSAMIDVALGGRAAEEMIYGYDDVTSGCSSDLVRATDVATRMIRSFGFSDKVGLVAHGDEESVYLSSKKKDEIEGEIRQFLDNGMERVKRLLKNNEKELHTLANALVEYETLSLDEVRQVLRGEKLDRPSASEGLKLVGEHEKQPEGPIVEGI